MKSKITKIQSILMKGIVSGIIIAMLVSGVYTLQYVYAEENDPDYTDFMNSYITGEGDNITNIDENTIQSLTADIAELKRQLAELNSNITYEDFLEQCEGNNITISSEFELRALSTYVEEGGDTTGRTFTLTKNIALSPIEWRPIGSKANPFKGTFNGSGFTVSGMVITLKQSCAGLFGYAQEATIKNVKIGESNFNILPEVDNVSNNDLASKGTVNYIGNGAVLGYGYKTNIYNCRNSANVNGGQNVGGIVGLMREGNIEDCNNTGYIKGYLNVGGIAGQLKYESGKTPIYKIERCKNTGEVFSIAGNVGGISGALSGSCKISKSLNNGTVGMNEAVLVSPYHGDTTLKKVPENAGGIVGWASGYNDSLTSEDNLVEAFIEECINEKNARIYGYQDVGGIAGQLGGQTSVYTVARIKNCIDYSTNINCILKDDYGKHAGKLAGACGAIKFSGIETNNNQQVEMYDLLSTGLITESYYIVNSDIINNENDSYGYGEWAHKTDENIVRAYGYRLKSGVKHQQITGFGSSYTEGAAQDAIRYVVNDNNTYEYYENKKQNDNTYKPEILNYGNNIGSTPEFRVKSEGEGENITYSIKENTIDPVNVDGNGPVITKNEGNKYNITVVNSGAQNLAIKGDVLTITVQFDEDIHYNRITPVLTVFGNEATFVGIGPDGKSLVFQYKLTGNETGELSTVKLTASSVNDVFGNNAQISETDYSVLNTIKAIRNNEPTVIIRTNTESNIAYKIEAPKLNIQDGNLYFKKGDEIKVTADLGGRIVNDVDISDIPVLNIKIKNNGQDKILIIGHNDNFDINIENNPTINRTTGEIEYKFTTEENGQITNVWLTTNGEIEYGPDDNKITKKLTKDEVGNKPGTKVDFTEDKIFIDTIAPTITLSANANMPKEKGRYTVGDVITITATSNEPIDLMESTRPNISVSFSESGTGKYNSGNAIYVSTIENKDENNNKISHTYTYKYIIQNGDEGELECDGSGEIYDLAGNNTTLTARPENSTVEPINLSNIKLMNRENTTTVSYTIYRNSEVINSFSKNTIFKNGDIIKVVADFSNDLYTNWGATTTTINSEIEKAPKLNIKGTDGFDITIENIDANDTTKQDLLIVNNSNKITYTYKIVDSINTKLTNLNLKINNVLYEKIDNNYITINSGTIDTPIDNANLYIHNSGIEFDTNSNIYADTTAPRVEIIPKGVEEITNFTTNMDSLLYEFKWSEEVVGFGVEDITVNNGTKNELSSAVRNDDGTYSYTMIIDSSVVSGNTGNLQVIVEQDAVQDIVGYGNIRTENTITVDKQAPILQNYSVKKENDKIIVEATYNETIAENLSNPLEIKFGDKKGYGNVSSQISGNKVTYTYTISGADDGKASIKIIDKVKDVVGNKSEPINAIVENDITLTKTLLRIGTEEYGFDFIDFSNKHYYKEGDTVTVIKNGVQYKYTVTGTFDNLQMKYMKLTEPANVGENGTAEFSAGYIAEYINITAANIFFDTKAPTMTVSATPENQRENSYSVGDEITITATASELLQETENKPEINVSFSESGLGKYNYQTNSSLGNARYIETVTTSDNKTQYIYKYVIQNGDEGDLSLGYANINRTITDIAGNATILRNDENTTFANSNVNVDTTAPVVSILPLLITDTKYDVDSNGIVDGRDYEALQRKIDNNENDIIYDFNGDSLVNVNDVTYLQKLLINTNITNKDPIKYEFIWNEEISNFNADNIIVSGGIKGELENINGTNIYIMDVTTNVAGGNEGELRVAVEQNAVQDLAGHGNIRGESSIVIDKKAPTAEITADKDFVKNGEEITYTVTWSEKVEGFTADDIAVSNNESVLANSFKQKSEINETTYEFKVKPQHGNDITVSIPDGKCTDVAGNTNMAVSHRISVVPTVTIEASTTNPTKENEITYTFTWSETVNGFTKEDIIVPEGAEKGDLTSNGNVYTLVVNYDTVIPNGNQGEVTVAVKENAVQDVDGNGNAYTNNTLKIDRIAPILISLEAYGESGIDVDGNVDTVKQYYKVESEKFIRIVATFSENIENSTAPTLNLQFSESGNSGNAVSVESIVGNKITYKYAIKNGDNGLLSVKGFSGTVKDTAGNETIVTKRALDGDTIIADTKAPELVSLTAVAPEFEYSNLVNGEPNDSIRYGVQSKNRENNTITIIAEYSENVYNLTSNSINKVTSSNAPKIVLEFSRSGKAKANANGEATFVKCEGNKLYYSYDITADENGENGDNGNISVKSISGTVSDLAGNNYTTTTNTSLPDLIEYISNTKLEGNDHIVADTTKSTYDVSVIEAIDKDDEGKQITGNNVDDVEYFRIGSTIKIEVTSTNEYVYNNTDKDLDCYGDVKIPEDISLKFGTNPSKGQLEYKGTRYENNKTIFTFEYIVRDMDNGKLTVIVPENYGYDIALNGNDLTSKSFNNIVADTERPYTATNTDRKTKFEIVYEPEDQPRSVTATALFNEKVYIKDSDNNLSLLSRVEDAPIMGVFKAGELVKTATARIENNNAATKLVYTADISDVDSDNISVNIINGTLYDRAGNEWSLDINADTSSPKFSEIQVLTEDGYYNKDKTLDFAVKFVEQTRLTTRPTLTIKIGDKSINLNGTVNEEDPLNTSLTKVARYSYKIVDENGPVTIVSLNGTVSDGTRNSQVAETFSGNNAKIKDYTGNQYINTSNAKVIVDTTAPYIVSIKADDKDELTTNKDKVTYKITWSEPVRHFNEWSIDVINGIIDSFEGENGDTEYTVTVDTIGEGRQTLKVYKNSCEDKAGNQNEEGTTFRGVVIDYTKPEVRAKVNGGKYVMNTDVVPETEKRVSILKETIVVNEELSELKYVWSQSDTAPEDEEVWTEVPNSRIGANSDIPLVYAAENTGLPYYLYIKATDIAGNTFEGKTNGFYVSNANIVFKDKDNNVIDSEHPLALTNQDVTINVDYQTDTIGLTENKRAGIQGKTQSADPTKVILTENGTVYAEATDINGNKVYATLAITNIDKTAPVINATANNKTITITSNDTDIAKYIVTTTSNVPAVNAEGWQNWGEENTKTVAEDGTYYVWAIDKAGNISEAKVVVIDTSAPVISVNVEGRNIEILSNDIGNKFLVTTTDTRPAANAEGWQNNNIIRVAEDGTYYVWAMDTRGNISEPTMITIDTTAPVINATSNNKTITITSDDTDIARYIVTTTSNVPAVNAEGWQTENTITVAEDGTYYVWAIDNKGNISEAKVIVIDTTIPEPIPGDTTAPIATINCFATQAVVGTEIGATITTNEDATIYYSWDNTSWTNSDGYVTWINATKTPTTAGTYTLYVKATDIAGNTSEVSTQNFTVVEKPSEITEPTIVVTTNDLIKIYQENNKKYLIISPSISVDELNEKITVQNGDINKLTIDNLNKDGKLKTNSYVKYDGATVYTIVVKGDVNSDGEVDFIYDINTINNYRLGKINTYLRAQFLASDINSDGNIDFINDIIGINDYRLGKRKSL